MDLKNFASQLIMEKIGSTTDKGVAASALDNLTRGNKSFDLGDLVAQFTGAGGDLAAKAQSWLGDGANDSISASQVEQALGGDKIEAFARQMGISKDEASHNLSDILPQLIDKSSRGGKLLNSIGGEGSLFRIASRFFK